MKVSMVLGLIGSSLGMCFGLAFLITAFVGPSPTSAILMFSLGLAGTVGSLCGIVNHLNFMESK